MQGCRFSEKLGATSYPQLVQAQLGTWGNIYLQLSIILNNAGGASQISWHHPPPSHLPTWPSDTLRTTYKRHAPMCLLPGHEIELQLSMQSSDANLYHSGADHGLLNGAKCAAVLCRRYDNILDHLRTAE